VIAAIVAWFSRLLDAKAQQRPYWLDERALPVVCAWHEDLTDPKNAHATHGICPACVAKFESGAAA